MIENHQSILPGLRVHHEGELSMRAMVRLLVVLGFAALAGCGGQKGYEKAFTEKSALSGNSQEFAAAAEQTFRTVKVTLVQQGFTIEQVDVATGLIKAVRSLQDPKKPKYAYLITTTVDVTGQPSGKSTTVTVAASQQTVLHKDSEKYFVLLGLVPIPTGRNYQTVVTKEGNIDTAGFYSDFFAAVNKNLRLAAAAAAPAAVTISPLPASSADVVPTQVPAGNSAPSPAAAGGAVATNESVAATPAPVQALVVPAPVVPAPVVPAPVKPTAVAPTTPVQAPAAPAAASPAPTALAPIDP
jgi:hypothetical protein